MNRYVVVLTNEATPTINRVVGPMSKVDAHDLRDRLDKAGPGVRVQVRALRDPARWSDADLLDEVTI